MKATLLAAVLISFLPPAQAKAGQSNQLSSAELLTNRAPAQLAKELGPGPLHKLFFPAGDARLGSPQLQAATKVRENYGSFVMLQVDEELFGGRAQLAAAGFDLRDEIDIIPLNGFELNGTRPLETLEQLEQNQRWDEPQVQSLDPRTGLYLVQFHGPVRDAWLEQLNQVGLEFSQYTPANAYVVSVPEANVWRLEALRESLPALQYLGAYQPAYRMTPSIRAAARDARGVSRKVTVQLINRKGVRAALELLEAMSSVPVQRSVAGPYLNVQAEIDPVHFEELALHRQVFAIEDRGSVARLDERQSQTVAGNVSGNGPSSPNYLSWLSAEGFNSTQFGSFSVNVVDDATSLTGHPDLPNSRIEFQLNPTGQTGAQGGHGFLNAHIVAGFNNGTGSSAEDSAGYNYGLGIAPWAQVGSTAIFGTGGLNPTAYESDAYQQGSRISTNSWSFQDGNQNPIPDYDSSAQSYDFITRDARSSSSGNQEYLVIFAAGNDGSGSNTVSTPGTAKNIITVGASENNRQTGTDGCNITNSGANSIEDMASFSSRGPVDASGGDGRWKPELVGPGTHIQAGVPQSNFDGGSSVCNGSWPAGQSLYGWSSGTSHSTPAIAGGAALLRQWFLNEGLSVPSPAMSKAVLAGTSEYMTGSGAGGSLPSNSQGLGRMNLGRSFDEVSKLFVDQDQLLSSTGNSYQLSGNVANTGEPVRIVLAWTDAPGSTTGAPWVNDLDLTVSIGGNTYRGNVFSGANSSTGGSADPRNNTEAVFLPAGTGGNFTITVTASTIAGDGVPGNGDGTDQDFALYVYNGEDTPSGPAALFTANTTSGIAPLSVNFTDQSTLNPTSWSWDFGDGNSSSQQNPSHTYTAPGNYTVSLSITAPGGSDTETKNNYINVVAPPTPGISDGSFQSQTAGTAPVAPWDIAFGSNHLVSPSGTTTDNGFPTHLSQWCELAADSTNGATPPSNPGGTTNPAVGGAGISQDFSYAAGDTLLEFDAAFLRNEDANQTQFNDWMSVDISDGSSTINLYYADTFSATSGTSAKYGYAMTPIENVSVDLSALFPSSSTATNFTLTALVGNGDDDFQPSKGYVDDFRLLASGEPLPVANFTATPTSGNAPLVVNFTNTTSGGPDTGWFWDFGDGGFSTLENPSHTFTSTGSYTVTLTSSGPGGSDVETKSGFINVQEQAPVANFTGSPTSGTLPLPVSFTNTTSGGPDTSWLWDFGDGGTSTAQNPNHTYTSAGTFTVTLTSTGPGGSDVESKSAFVTVDEQAPVANFTGSPTSGTLPLPVSFTNTSTGGPDTGWFWDFGDGAFSTVENPSHTYTNAGNYTVSLTSSGPGGSDSETKTAFVTVDEQAPVANFTGSPTSGVLPLPVSFTNTTSGGPDTSWLWDFGDGGTSTSENPNHTYTSAGSYTVTLTSSGPGGSDVMSKTAFVTVDEQAPVANFSGTPTTGTLPLAVSFNNTSTGGPDSGWFWDFGDGAFSTLENPSHTYTNAGTFTVSLTSSGPGGSDSETKTAFVTVDEQAPVANFSGSPTSGVLPLPVSFTNTTSGGPDTSWLWNFGDGSTSTLENPSHTYTTAGNYTVTLTSNGPGGGDVETKTSFVTVDEQAPVADFSGSPTSGVLPLPVSFTNTTSGGPDTSWLWNFGDGSTSTLENPSHTYTTAGNYTVTLTSNGPGGSDLETKASFVTVDEQAPVADFTGSPTSGVLPLPVSFTNTTSGGPDTSWLWNFGDGSTSTSENPSHTYTTAGNYTVTLTSNGPGGSDLETKTAFVTVDEQAPVANFSGSPTSGVLPLPVSFTNTTSGGPDTSWLWNFGDGSTSTSENPSHTYTTAGNYTVTLTSSGPGGSDAETKADFIEVTASEIYCAAKTNSLGCIPQIGSVGSPSASSSSAFLIQGSNVLNQRNGLLFYGLAGRADVPFLGGTLCVAPPLRRLPIQSAGGNLPPTTDCSGVFSFDFNALVQSGTDVLLVPGQQVNAQWWSRDPMQIDGTGVGLTDGIEFVIGN